MNRKKSSPWFYFIVPFLCVLVVNQAWASADKEEISEILRSINWVPLIDGLILVIGALFSGCAIFLTGKLGIVLTEKQKEILRKEFTNGMINAKKYYSSKNMTEDEVINATVDYAYTNWSQTLKALTPKKDRVNLEEQLRRKVQIL